MINKEHDPIPAVPRRSRDRAVLPERSVVLAAVLGALVMLVAGAAPAGAAEWVERRRDQFGKDFGYFLYPLVSTIPGLGTAQGAGATVLNIGGTDTDFTGFKIGGDFAAGGYALLDLHAVPRRLIFDVGYYDFEVAPVAYHRGIRSSKDDVIHPHVEGAYAVAQATVSFHDRLFEVYVRELRGAVRMLSVLDKDGNEFAAIDTNKRDARTHTVGAVLDDTDDRLDPRKGVRVEVAAKIPVIDDPNLSRYYITDVNVTGYVPFRQWDTLALNLFHSDAHVTRQASTDFAELQQKIGLGCGSLPPGPEQDRCLATEAAFITERIAENRYGSATSLGGTQRLRSFDGGRFYAGHAFFYGLEYRLNLTDERTPFDIYIAKGIRTGIQAAFFVERGTVLDEWKDHWKGHKMSYGAGLRLVLSGVVIRVDVSRGDEGGSFLLFINYPWSMFSVDSPG